MLFASDPTPVIQVEWQGLAVLGSSIGAAILGAAKILASQWEKNNKEISSGISSRHEENRLDAKEYREENRQLSQLILDIQARTVQTLVSLQSNIEHLSRMLGACDVPKRGDETKKGNP